MRPSHLAFLGLLSLVQTVISQDGNTYTQIKGTGFKDPHTDYTYLVTSYNVNSTIEGSPLQKSVIKVSRVKLNQNGKIISAQETIQSIGFDSTLIDFDLHCPPTHCYLVTVSSRPKLNVRLYSWTRTQFDVQAKRDSFARPSAVKLFRIQSAFYVALAQDQLNLSPRSLHQEDEENTKFIGCAVFKFVRGHEQHLKYHQFIRLPYNPRYVGHYVSVNSNFINRTGNSYPSENHYLIFSVQPNWNDSSLVQTSSYIWSPLNDYFWPYRLPRGIELGLKPGTQVATITFPSQLLPRIDSTRPADGVEPIESCFIQLQRILSDRDQYAQKLIHSSRSLWRSSRFDGIPNAPFSGLANVSAQVIVHGNVIVEGSLIESPQISLLGQGLNRPMTNNFLSGYVNNHSPAIVENNLKKALYKLRYIRDKLSRAVFPSSIIGIPSVFNSRVTFLGNIFADLVTFRGPNGIANSNVRLNGIPFRQLEHELVSLRGSQDIPATVIFQGNVVADLLEIHGKINEHYYLKDAVDITTNRLQVLDTVNQPGAQSLVFESVGVSELAISTNATINGVILSDFITRDGRTQIVYGRKSFRDLSMARLTLAHPGILLNGFDIHHIAINALHLRSVKGDRDYQIINARHLGFSKLVRAKNLIIDGLINRQINISYLILDSVKTSGNDLQLISGHKRFLNSLHLANLTTEGTINGVHINQIFNLNPTPPVSDHAKYSNPTQLPQPPIRGRFQFLSPVTVEGSLNAHFINTIDVAKRAIRRYPPYSNASNVPQIVNGLKIFSRPLRVINSLRLLYPPALSQGQYPLINGLDIRYINSNIKKQMMNPSVIYIDNLEINGNINLETSRDFSGEVKTTLGNFSICPLDIFRNKIVLASPEEQVLDKPIHVTTLRARSVALDPGSLNGFNFPSDFVLRSNNVYGGPNNHTSFQPEVIFGHKSFEHLSVSPLLPQSLNVGDNSYGGRTPFGLVRQSQPQGIILGQQSSINSINYNELQTFIQHERRKNSTGETVLRTLNIHGTLRARRINGYNWPEDIILKSLASYSGPAYPSQVHRRIYSHLIFSDSNDLEIANQLVLRGPVQLEGKFNGINLTEFARQSATYGDKDLLSVGRPIRNKVFVGGITVRGQVRSLGLVDGINIDEMVRRVVKIGPKGVKIPIMSPKMFMSDVDFFAHVNVLYLNDLLLDHYLRRINFQNDGRLIKIFGKKIVTGALRINKNLIVRGLVNGVDFADLKARAISLSPTNSEIKFNKTLTIEGDVFLDNLLIDERDGAIDGVRLMNLLPIDPTSKNEIIIASPSITKQNLTQGYGLRLAGMIGDCGITCLLARPQSKQLVRQNPVILQPQPLVSYPPRQIQYNGRNISYMRTTPPYAVQTEYHAPLVSPLPPPKRHISPDQNRIIHNLVRRKPLAIQYEGPATAERFLIPNASPIATQQLEIIRQQIVTLNLVRLPAFNNLVVGFIESPFNDVGNLVFPEQDPPHSGHINNPRSFLQLDQVDFPFLPTTYHLSVGVATYHDGPNITSVYTSVGENGSAFQLSVLPIESPNSAMFLKIPYENTLFLLISQDYTITSDKKKGRQCPRYRSSRTVIGPSGVSYSQPEVVNEVTGGIHVYLFHSLQNSSSLTSAYFDLYQTIDLPAIDGFESFNYYGSTYALAVSRPANRVYLLLLRGYSGFQIVSYINTPMVDYVKLVYTMDHKPTLLIYQTNGLHKIMESVII